MPKIITMPKRFDYSAMSVFNAAINDSLDVDDKQILLDCMQMDYIDSSGLGLIVMAFKRAQKNKCHLSIINAKPTAKEILLLANLQKLMEIH